MLDTTICPRCKQTRALNLMHHSGGILPAIAAKMHAMTPDWAAPQPVCEMCIAEGTAAYKQDILKNLPQDGPLSAELPLTTMERFARRVARVIGSWQFASGVALGLSLWISLNILFRPFEPYPIIILAIISATLGSIAALQGPFILMAQRAATQRDRLRDQQDYAVNLKAELEIRLLHEKLDYLLEQQAQLTDRDRV